MKRRSFIKRTTGLTIPLMLGKFQISAMENPVMSSLNLENDKVLVLIQLGGGNDGLNTVVPLDQYDNLAQVRSNVLLPENQLIGINETLAFHPAMGELKGVHDDGKLSLIQGVGYPNQNRSHFRSTDIWNSGSNAEDVWLTGWLGRYFELLGPGYPAGYPNEAYPDPFAVTIGTTVNGTCEGEVGNFSLALVNPDNLTALATPINGSNIGTCFGDKLDFLTTSIIQTNQYNETVEAANANGNNLSTKYADTKLAEALKVVARMISGGLDTKVYIVNLGGFDTHGDQVVEGDTGTGVHAELLAELSNGIAAFQDDLQLMGLEEQVIGMTYSEFGRRIRSNDGLGTDHGSAAPMFLFGSCVNPGVLGDNAEISVEADEQEGVAMQYDFRSIYGSILMDWFQVEEQVVRDLLFEDFQYLSILKDCTSVSNTTEVAGDHIELEVFPNPFSDRVSVQFSIPAGFAKISLYDAIGSELRVVTAQSYGAGQHTIKVETHSLAAGSYYFRIQTLAGVKVKRMVKV